LKSCFLIKDLLIKHNINPVWITCNPDNIASIKTIEKIGAAYVETIDVPEENEIYQQGEFRKNRYKWSLIV